jgi:two-component system, LytTR family, sensor kinase
VALIEVEDDAGAYAPPAQGEGSGLHIVDARIRALAGDQYGVSIDCVPQRRTLVTVRIPAADPAR